MRDTKSAKILVADDNVQNVELLEAHLAIAGYETISCNNGHDTIRIATGDKPDLILLDVMMPHLNGFEVCKKLKSQPETKFIPIIMLTALKEVEDKIKGIEAGAEEFLSKPFNKLELLTRVKSLLKLKFLHEDLENRNHELNRTLEHLRNVELLKEDLIHMLIHDLKNPLHGINLSLSLVLNEQLGPLNAEQKDFIRDAKLGAENLLGMVSDLLDITKMEESRMKLQYEEISVKELSEEVIRSLEIAANENNISVRLHLQDEGLTFNADRNIVNRVLTNLLSNAIKHSFTNQAVDLEFRCEDNLVIALVKDYGEGIPSEFHTVIFEKFGQVDSKKKGYKFDTGLGLTFCKMAVEAHGGKVWLESEEGKGSTFYFSLPQNVTC